MADTTTVLIAGFRAGWVAACLTIADQCEKNGGPDLAPFFREMANHPAPVQVGDLRTPEGQAMKAKRGEVVFMETVRKEPKP